MWETKELLRKKQKQIKAVNEKSLTKECINVNLVRSVWELFLGHKKVQITSRKLITSNHSSLKTITYDFYELNHYLCCNACWVQNKYLTPAYIAARLELFLFVIAVKFHTWFKTLKLLKNLILCLIITSYILVIAKDVWSKNV